LVITRRLLCNVWLSCSGLRHLGGHVMLTLDIFRVKPLPLHLALDQLTSHKLP